MSKRKLEVAGNDPKGGGTVGTVVQEGGPEGEPAAAATVVAAAVGGGTAAVTVGREVVQLRTSARVLRKKESEVASAVDELQSGGGSVLQHDRSGGGGGGGGGAGPGTSAAVSGAATSEQPEEKPRRAWEQWSGEDKNTFFEGLNECGKNFDAIQGYFQSKLKKQRNSVAGGSVYKNKEQIRTFYYRQWHKISKYIKFPEQLKKSTLAVELYGLINYGELRKRIGSRLDKNGAKLQELVWYGHTTIRGKGKNYRLRTPVCRALKRLNNRLDPSNKNSASKTTAPLLPTKVTIDLKPLKEEDFFHVHALCFQNPHVQLTVKMSASLGAVLDHLERKWIPAEQKLKSCLRNTMLPPSQQPYLPSAEASDTKLRRDRESRLVLMTTPGAKIRQPIILAVEPVTSTTLSLSHIQSKLESEASNSKSKGEKDGGSPEQDHVKVKQESHREVGRQLSTDLKLLSKDQERDAQVGDKVRSQWTRDEAAALTIGELYLMLGSSQTNTIELCYTWKRPSSERAGQDSKKSIISMLHRLAVAELSRKHQPKLSSQSSPGFHRNGGCRSNAFGSFTSPPSTTAPYTNLTDSPQEKSPTGGEGGGEFRRPADPPPPLPQCVMLPTPSPQQSAQTQAFRQQLNRLMPKYTNRRGRPMNRKNVISRQLVSNRPLQPNPYLESNGFKLRILSNSEGNKSLSLPMLAIPSQSGMSQAPHSLRLQATGMNMANSPVTIVIPQNGSLAQIVQPHSMDNISSLSPSVSVCHQMLDIPQIVIPETAAAVSGHMNRTLSPTGSSVISALFNDNSMGELTSTPTKCDQFLDSILENSNSSVLRTPPRHRPTPPTSPSRAVSESWLPELSLSSFLNLGESPSKGGICGISGSGGGVGGLGGGASSSTSGLNLNEDSSHSTNSEVERQFMSMLTENSVDFTMKFAKLASHVSDGDG